jgi:hypothetical protein
MYRLLYSELSRIIGRQLSVKIEMLASMLCELSLESIENLDNFRTHAMNSLSIVCSICTISFPRSQMETMFLCEHICCLICIKNYYRNNIIQIGDYQSLNRLTCFQEAHQITNETKMNFFIHLESKVC